MRRIVRRRWFSKKKQTWVEKEYVYDYKKSRRGRILVDKYGRINKKNVGNLKKQLAIEFTNPVELNYMLNEVDNIIDDVKEHKRELRTTGFYGRLTDNGITRMFTNMGTSVDEVASEYNLDVNDLLEKNNWDFTGNTFTDPVTGKVYNFKFTYTGSIFY